MRRPDCTLSAASTVCECVVCGPSINAEDRAAVAEMIALKEENDRRSGARERARAESGLSRRDFARSPVGLAMPQPDYARMMALSPILVAVHQKQLAALNAHLERTAAADLRAAFADPSFSHLRHTRDNDGIYIYNVDASSPSGVRLAFTIPLTNEVRALLAARHAVVNDGPSRGMIAESAELRQTFYR